MMQELVITKYIISYSNYNGYNITGVYGLKHIEVTAKEENVINDWDYSELPENIYVIDRGQDSTPTYHADPIAVTETT